MFEEEIVRDRWWDRRWWDRGLMMCRGFGDRTYRYRASSGLGFRVASSDASWRGFEEGTGAGVLYGFRRRKMRKEKSTGNGVEDFWGTG